MNAATVHKETALSAALAAANLKTEASQADPRLHGRGAKASKVPAIPTGTATMKEFAETEAGLILEHGMARMKHWVMVGNAYKFQPELLKQYPEALRNALYHKVKLPIPTALAPKSQWTDALSVKLANSLDVEVSQCRRAFSAMSSEFSSTIKLLEGKGTYQDKIKQLPTTSRAGRKARQPDGPEGDGTETAANLAGGTGTVNTAKPAEKQLLTLGSVISAVNSMSENDLSKVIQAIAVRCKDSKLGSMNRLASDLFKALDEYDGTAQAIRNATPKAKAA